MLCVLTTLRARAFLAPAPLNAVIADGGTPALLAYVALPATLTPPALRRPRPNHHPSLAPVPLTQDAHSLARVVVMLRGSNSRPGLRTMIYMWVAAGIVSIAQLGWASSERHTFTKIRIAIVSVGTSCESL